MALGMDSSRADRDCIMQKAGIYQDLVAAWAGTEPEMPDPAAVAGGTDKDTAPPPERPDHRLAAEARE